MDLSVPLSMEFPINWPTLLPFRKRLINWFEDFDVPSGERVRSQCYYYAQSLEIDEHTGTHLDYPIHVLPPEELKKLGVELGPPLGSFAGPAVGIDVTIYLNKASPGHSPRLPIEVVEAWEKRHGSIPSWEIVLFNTGYMDQYFTSYPEGNRLVREPLLERKVPGWPALSDHIFELLGELGVRHLGIDTPSIGALDDPSGPHQAGVKRGMTYAECLIHLDRLLLRGALYVGFPLRIANQSGSPIRAVAFKPKKQGGHIAS